VAKLTDDVKTFIVTQLACFASPSDIQAQLKTWDPPVTISVPGITHYDPTTVNGAAQLAPKWVDLFTQTRDRFTTQLADIAIYHQTYRLAQLQRLFKSADSRGNIVLAASLLEQAAKEVGQVYTNRQELTGKGGAPLHPPGPPVVGEAERAARVDDLLGRALQRMAAAGAAGGPGGN
jgi:hypothetical protein